MTKLDWIAHEHEQGTQVFVSVDSIVEHLHACVRVSDFEDERIAVCAAWALDISQRLKDFAATVVVDIVEFNRGEKMLPHELHLSVPNPLA